MAHRQCGPTVVGSELGPSGHCEVVEAEAVARKVLVRNEEHADSKHEEDDAEEAQIVEHVD